MLLADRHDASRQFSEHLVALKQKNSVVLALPRGGVPVGLESTRALEAPLDLVLVRKIGAPLEEELAIGAIADGQDPELVTNAQLVADLDISADYLEAAKSTALQEIERRRRVYLGNRQPVGVVGRTAIVVDDGLATGAAVRAIRRRNPARIVLVVPVASNKSCSHVGQACIKRSFETMIHARYR